jgi:hypothetical protein
MCDGSVNIGAVTHQDRAETRSIGSLIYKHLKLKKKKNKKSIDAQRTAFKQFAGHVLS